MLIPYPCQSKSVGPTPRGCPHILPEFILSLVEGIFDIPCWICPVVCVQLWEISLWHGHLGRVFHGLQARAILGNYRIIYMDKHIR